MKRSLLRIFNSLCALISVPLGGLTFIVSIMAIIDPVGTKMADDADPFGKPPGATEIILQLLVSLVLMIWPFVLQRYLQRRKAD